MMLDGIETIRLAVNERDLIKRLDIHVPFSPTNGDVRDDLPLVPSKYIGMHVLGKRRGPHCQGPGLYWFTLRSSFIKAANNGLHNNDPKDPFQILYAMDELVTKLRFDPFHTPLNGLEISATICVENAQQICENIVSYLHTPPNHHTIPCDGLDLPYVEIEVGQHKLKLYAPQPNALRIEVKIDKMQFLGKDRPMTFADLVKPRFAALLANKLLAAFGKIIWKYGSTDLASLTAEERNLYLLGRDRAYWQVKREEYADKTGFKRVEKLRSREKKLYNKIVQRNWIHEPPAEIARRMIEQLARYEEIMHSPLYQALLKICLKRWQNVGNLPNILRLPKYLKLPPLSEIYPLYLGRFPTPPTSPYSYQTQGDLSTNDQGGQRSNYLEVFTDYAASISQSNSHESRPIKKRQPSRIKYPFTNQLYKLQKVINTPGGLNYSLADLTPILSTSSLIALADTNQSLVNLRPSGNHQVKPLPLFCF